MKYFKSYGSKERLFEMMANVNKGRLKEEFDYHGAEMDHLGQQDLEDQQAQDLAATDNVSPDNQYLYKMLTTVGLTDQDINKFLQFYSGGNADKKRKIDFLMSHKIMEKEPNGHYVFSAYYRDAVKDADDLQRMLMGHETKGNRADRERWANRGNDSDSEAPYLRGYEPSP